MSLAGYVNEFTRQPWRSLFAACGAEMVLVALMGRHSALPQLCGGSWSRAVAAIGPADALALALATTSLPGLAAEWLVMLGAMMPPLLAQPIAHVCRSSRPAGRARAVAGFVLGYGLVWMSAGPVLVMVSLLFSVCLGNLAPAAVVVVALAWSASPWHQAALNRGHRVRRLSVLGWRADRDAVAYGLVHGGWCLATCWAWMLVPLAFAGHHLAVMMAIALILLAERLALPAVPRWRWPTALSAPARAMARLWRRPHGHRGPSRA